MEAGHLHGILLDQLAVLLYEEDGGWFAQGLQIDHFAQGTTEDEAKKSFTKSLKWTMEDHLKQFGKLEYLLTPAPAQVWKDFWAQVAKNKQVTCLWRINIGEKNAALESALKGLPLGEVAFLKADDKPKEYAAASAV